jgi:hypothetical protein
VAQAQGTVTGKLNLASLSCFKSESESESGDSPAAEQWRRGGGPEPPAAGPASADGGPGPGPSQPGPGSLPGSPRLRLPPGGPGSRGLRTTVAAPDSGTGSLLGTLSARQGPRRREP